MDDRKDSAISLIIIIVASLGGIKLGQIVSGRFFNDNYPVMVIIFMIVLFGSLGIWKLKKEGLIYEKCRN